MSETTRHYELRSPDILDDEPFCHIEADLRDKSAFVEFDYVAGPTGQYPSLSAAYAAIARWYDALPVRDDPHTTETYPTSGRQ